MTTDARIIDGKWRAASQHCDIGVRHLFDRTEASEFNFA
jgi:hypothetical protein